MCIKLYHKYLFIIAAITLLWNQQISYVEQKLAIEKAYHDKIESAVSPILVRGKFYIIVNVEFSTVGGTLKKTGSLQSGSGATDELFRTMGLEISPSPKSPTSASDPRRKSLSAKDYDIGRVEVTIGLDETSITESEKLEIKSLVEKIIPLTKDCDDCIKIEAGLFPSNPKDEILQTLEDKIDTLEAQKRRADLKKDTQRLVDLERQLDETQKARDGLQTLESRRQLQQIEQDSIRFAQLLKADSTRFANTEKRLERVIESKIKSDSVIIREAMGIMKQQAVGEKDDESLLGMQVGGSGSGIMGYVIIILLIICLMIVAILAAGNKKPKTVYLKPKGKGKEKDKKKDKNGSDEGDETSELPPEPATPPPPRADEDAMRSEIRSLRQTAVSLSVGEKEGASALIKEWLEDNPNKEDEGEEEAGEE